MGIHETERAIDAPLRNWHATRGMAVLLQPIAIESRHDVVMRVNTIHDRFLHARCKLFALTTASEERSRPGANYLSK